MRMPPLSIGRYCDKLKQLKPKKSPSKFGNIKTEVITSGTPIIYDSRKEAKIGQQLQYRQVAGEISNLKRQVPFRFELNGILICKYLADFTYIENGKYIVVDVKSKFTAKLPVYVLKRKMMKAFHGIDITEVIA